LGRKKAAAWPALKESCREQAPRGNFNYPDAWTASAGPGSGTPLPF
jgi:hypothetical protein